MDLTPDQIVQLQSLGINLSSDTPSKPITNQSKEIKKDHKITPTLAQTSPLPVISTQTNRVLKKPNNPIVPILSISGLSLISFGGLILLKSKETSTISSPPTQINNPEPIEGPTQVPKSIQHYLLTSQQLFTQALALQSSSPTGNPQMLHLVNQSILAATEAIKEFPSDHRSYEQRGRIYQSLVDSQPQLANSAIADFSRAYELNPSVDTAHNLAFLYGKAGDAQKTIYYLSQTVNLEPTKAQNFYDLARLQQQVGLLPQALDNYNRLLTLVTDPVQKQQIEIEKTSLEQLLAQNHTSNPTLPSPSTSKDKEITLPDNPNLIQASLPAQTVEQSAGLIIAAPETSPKIEVKQLTSTNALSGSSILPANTKEISISNQNLTPTSQVYLTITKGGKNLVLQVLSRSKDSFVAGLDSPTIEDIEFKWWIVN